MTWELTPEEEFDPLLLPPVTMEYPRPLPSAEEPYLIGSPDVNKWTSGRDPYDGYESQGYSGPVSPIMYDQPPVFPGDKLEYDQGRGRRVRDFQAPYPSSFWPEVVRSPEQIFNRQPGASYQERLWPGSDVRVDFTYAERPPVNQYPGRPGIPGSSIQGLGDETAVWYETPGGSLLLAAGTAVAAYAATRYFLRRKSSL